MSVVSTPQVCGVLRDRCAKWIARITGRHPETCARWRRGETEPSASELVALMAADAELFSEIARLAGRATEARRMHAAEMLRKALAAMGDAPP